MYLNAPAMPVRMPPGDNLWLHRAVYAAAPGEVLVVDTGGRDEYGYWGEILTVAAAARGLAGLVITGGVRDVRRLAEIGLPVFSGSVSILGSAQDPAGDGVLGEPVTIGSVVVNRGDTVIGDADGVVVIAAADRARVLEAGAYRDAKEAAVMERLRAGETTLSIYDLPGR
jgi:4-hydroxy-4-methyl-2-oxoglutarate aldolase